MRRKRVSRRTVPKTAAALGVRFLPRRVLGGKGHSDVVGMSSENIVALCDVDEHRAGGTP